MGKELQNSNKKVLREKKFQEKGASLKSKCTCFKSLGKNTVFKNTLKKVQTSRCFHINGLWGLPTWPVVLRGPMWPRSGCLPTHCANRAEM